MRILYCVQRYGSEIAGGAEAACRNLAERMVQRGHEVEVITTCALSYADWSNHYQPGTSVISGVLVHRLEVGHPRDNDVFGPLHHRVNSAQLVPAAVESDWLRQMGPEVPDLTAWLDRHSDGFDVVVFYTYLYTPAALGLPVAAIRAPTVLHPAAHDEPAFWLHVFDRMWEAADGFSCQTPEEIDLVERRARRGSDCALVGMGVDPPASRDGAGFRSRFGLGDDDYVLYLGRVDPGKGPDELHRFMVTLLDAGRIDARFVIVGEPVVQLAPHPGVVFTGFVDEITKHDAIDGCTVFVQPSYFESFSLSLAEAWLHSKPALVQRACGVLAGQARRSGGALPYSGLAEFEEGLARLLHDEQLRNAIGQRGRDYVESLYQWPAVLGRYEAFLGEVARTSTKRRRRTAAA